MPRDKRLHFKDIPAMRALAFIPIYLYFILYLISFSDKDSMFMVINGLKTLVQVSFDFSFFLSAFLITSHALREYKYIGTFSIKNFFFRRIFKLATGLIFVLAFAFVIHPWLIRLLELQPIATPGIKPFLLFVANFFYNPANDSLIYIKVICYLYMFIQFYLVLGLILRFFHKHLAWVSVVLILVGLVARWVHLVNSTDFSLDPLAYGIPVGFGLLVAEAVRNESKLIKLIKSVKKGQNIGIYVVGLLFLVGSYFALGKTYGSVFIPLISGLFFVYVVVEQTFGSNSFVKLKTKKILSYFGKISYGMFVYQSIIGILLMIAAGSLDFNLSSIYVVLLLVIVGFVSTAIAADLSYKLFEKPLLRIRREFKKI
jgi:peptidoglycan/LPS O-acetylase OafA/YrhL